MCVCVVIFMAPEACAHLTVRWHDRKTWVWILLNFFSVILNKNVTFHQWQTFVPWDTVKGDEPPVHGINWQMSLGGKAKRRKQDCSVWSSGEEFNSCIWNAWSHMQWIFTLTWTNSQICSSWAHVCPLVLLTFILIIVALLLQYMHLQYVRVRQSNSWRTKMWTEKKKIGLFWASFMAFLQTFTGLKCVREVNMTKWSPILFMIIIIIIMYYCESIFGVVCNRATR